MKFSFIFYSFFLISILSCGKSPILNQKDIYASGNYHLQTPKIFRSNGIKLSLSWLTAVNSTDKGEAFLLTSKDGVLTDLPLPFSLFLWMPTMNHGSSPISITQLSTGVYKLSDIYFIMDGQWQLRAQLKSGNIVLEEIFFEFNL